MSVFWLALLLLGCDPDELDPGTAVGNPGDMDAAAVDVPVEVSLDAVWVDVAGVGLERCGGGAIAIPAGVTLDGLVPSFAPVPLPAGSFCGVVLELSGPVVLVGVTSLNTTFTVELDVGELRFGAPFTVDGDTLIVGVPIPVDAALLDDLGDGAVVLADDPVAVDWADLARTDAVLATDDDLDGRVGPDDTVVSRTTSYGIGDPSDAAYAVQSAQGCGCSQGASGGWLAGLLVLLALGRRSR